MEKGRRIVDVSEVKEVKFIQVKLVDGKPAIEIEGKVSKEDIEEAISRSKKLID